MANYFIGSVGTAEAFKIEMGVMKPAFISKTLTASTINISSTKEELRAGSGAPVVASFHHSPTVDITLTDVMWKRGYVESQLGATFGSEDGVATNYKTETIIAGDGVLTLNKQPVGLPLSCEGVETGIVWVAEAGNNNWNTYEFGNDKTVASADFVEGKKYCVRYLAEEISAKEAIIYSNMIPQELFLIITASLFAGDKCSVSNGSYVGEIVFEVPRFKLNGEQEFTLDMAANTTMSLNGAAYAEDDGCEAHKGGKLVRIIETIFANAEALPDRIFISESTRTVAEMGEGGTLSVYGIFEGSVVKLLSNTENAEFTVTSASGTVSTGGAIGGTWLAGDTVVAAFKLGAAEDPSDVVDTLHIIA